MSGLISGRYVHPRACLEASVRSRTATPRQALVPGGAAFARVWENGGEAAFTLVGFVVGDALTIRLHAAVAWVCAR